MKLNEYLAKNAVKLMASITSNYTVKANLTSGDWSGTVSFACTISGN